MVKSLRFWVQVFGTATLRDGRLETTPFGDKLLGSLDPYLESPLTLWLLHWRACSHVEAPLLAWEMLINRSTRPEFSRSQFVRAAREFIGKSRRGSDVTLAQHFDIFIHTYAGTSSRRGDVREDSLDSPLTELDLLAEVGDRVVPETRRRETVYSIRRAPRVEIPQAFFAYCVADYWRLRRPSEDTVSFEMLYDGAGSPGRILRLQEAELRERLDGLERNFSEFFGYRESQGIQQLRRQRPLDDRDMKKLLTDAYREA